MSYYSGTITALTKDILGCILNSLKEEHWYKLKWNSKILVLMSGLHKKGKIEELARHGHIESLNGRKVRFEYICEAGSLNLVVGEALVDIQIGIEVYMAPVWVDICLLLTLCCLKARLIWNRGYMEHVWEVI